MRSGLEINLRVLISYIKSILYIVVSLINQFKVATRTLGITSFGSTSHTEFIYCSLQKYFCDKTSLNANIGVSNVIKSRAVGVENEWIQGEIFPSSRVRCASEVVYLT